MKRMGFTLRWVLVVTWVGFSLMLSIGCVSQVSDMSCASPYKDQIGVKYELVMDSYVVTVKEMDDLFLVNQLSSFRLPYPVDARNIGKSTRDLNIKGVIPKGTIVTITAVQGVNSFDAGSTVDYYLELQGRGSELRLRLNGCYLEEREGVVYRLNERSFLMRH